MKKNIYSAKTGSSIGLSLLLLSSHSLVLGDAQGSSPDTVNHAPAINMEFNYPGFKVPENFLTIADVQIDAAAAKNDNEAEPQETEKVEEGTSGWIPLQKKNWVPGKTVSALWR